MPVRAVRVALQNMMRPLSQAEVVEDGTKLSVPASAAHSTSSKFTQSSVVIVILLHPITMVLNYTVSNVKYVYTRLR